MKKQETTEKNLENAQKDDESFYACSAWDCTGLIPSLPENEEELDAYEDIYPYIQRPVEQNKK